MRTIFLPNYKCILFYLLQQAQLASKFGGEDSLLVLMSCLGYIMVVSLRATNKIIYT